MTGSLNHTPVVNCRVRQGLIHSITNWTTDGTDDTDMNWICKGTIREICEIRGRFAFSLEGPDSAALVSERESTLS